MFFLCYWSAVLITISFEKRFRLLVLVFRTCLKFSIILKFLVVYFSVRVFFVLFLMIISYYKYPVCIMTVYVLLQGILKQKFEKFGTKRWVPCTKYCRMCPLIPYESAPMKWSICVHEDIFVPCLWRYSQIYYSLLQLSHCQKMT